MSWLHIHVYKLEEDWTDHNWGGVICARRIKRCRCGATKVKVKGWIE
jgi:hypothetical protein